MATGRSRSSAAYRNSPTQKSPRNQITTSNDYILSVAMRRPGIERHCTAAASGSEACVWNDRRLAKLVVLAFSRKNYPSHGGGYATGRVRSIQPDGDGDDGEPAYWSWNMWKYFSRLATQCIVITPVCLCVCLCLFVCGFVTTITRNCMHLSSPDEDRCL